MSYLPINKSKLSGFTIWMSSARPRWFHGKKRIKNISLAFIAIKSDSFFKMTNFIRLTRWRPVESFIVAIKNANEPSNQTNNHKQSDLMWMVLFFNPSFQLRRMSWQWVNWTELETISCTLRDHFIQFAEVFRLLITFMIGQLKCLNSCLNIHKQPFTRNEIHSMPKITAKEWSGATARIIICALNVDTFANDQQRGYSSTKKMAHSNRHQVWQRQRKSEMGARRWNAQFIISTMVI